MEERRRDVESAIGEPVSVLAEEPKVLVRRKHE